jgi:hypothetical protein
VISAFSSHLIARLEHKLNKPMRRA